MIALLLTAVVVSTAGAMTKKAGDYTVDVTMDRNPPVMGKNNVEIGVKDKTGKPVTDARVTVEYSMPAMPGMPAMNYKSDAELKGETYKAVISPSMAGSWNVAIKVTRGRQNGYREAHHRREIARLRRCLCRSLCEGCGTGLPQPSAFSRSFSPWRRRVAVFCADETVSLDDLIAEGLRNSPEILAAQARAEAAGYRIPQAKSLPDPMFMFGYQNEGFQSAHHRQTGQPQCHGHVRPFPAVLFPGKTGAQGGNGDAGRREPRRPLRRGGGSRWSRRSSCTSTTSFSPTRPSTS